MPNIQIYERTRIELVFFEDGRRSVDGHKILQRAPYCFVEVAVGKNFIMPYPMYDKIDYQDGSGKGTLITPDIVKIHVFDKRFMPFDEKIKLMFFSDV